MAADTAEEQDQLAHASADTNAMNEEEALPALVPALEPKEEAGAIEQLEQAAEPKEGDNLYLISSRWWEEWCAYSEYDSDPSTSDGNTQDQAFTGTHSRPSEIDNLELTVYNSISGFDVMLKDDLEEGVHFVVVTEHSWQQLHSWYGGGPAIQRKAVVEGAAPHSKRPRVMLYPLKVEAYYSGSKAKPQGPPVWVEIDKSATVADLKAKLCAVFQVQEADTVLWDYYKHSKYMNLEKEHMNDTVTAAKILEEQPILLQDKSAPDAEEDSAPSPILLGPGDLSSPSTRYGRSSYSSTLNDSIVERMNVRRGLAGLQNLGNTCFMNSSLQCLMHAVPVMRVFFSCAYESDINTTNPLGMKGELATAFGALMGNVWKGNVGVVIPRSFKARISAFAPQFSGYQQHDSQEFLAFLLDGLHEDINRIKEKPYIEEKDHGSRPDAELAAEAWANYRARNDSAIVDHFQGLYKSTLDCPKCSYSSVKFDPFMYLSLPLPESRVRSLCAIVIRADGAAPPVEYGVQVPQTGTLKDLYATVCRTAGVAAEHPEAVCCAATIDIRYGSYGLNTYPDARARISETLTPQSTSVLVYLYPSPEEGPGPDKRQLMVYHRNQHPYPATSSSRLGFFSAPLLLWLPKDEALVEPEQIAERKTPSRGNGKELVVLPGAQIWGRIHQMLGPFRDGPIYEGPDMSEPGPSEANMANGQDATASAAIAAHMQQAGPPSTDLRASSFDEHMGGTTPKHPSSEPAGAGPDGAADAADAAAAAGASGRGEDMATTPSATSWADRGAAALGASRAGAASPIDGTWGSSIAGSDIGDVTTPATTPAGGVAGVADVADEEDEWGERQPPLLEPAPVAGLSTADDGGLAVPVPQAFDMWSAQVSPAPDPSELPDALSPIPGAAPAAIPPPYELKLATDKGLTEWFLFGIPSTDEAKRTHGHFVLDWNPSAAAAAAAAAARPSADAGDPSTANADPAAAGTAAAAPSSDAAMADGPSHAQLPPPMPLTPPLLVGGYNLVAMEQPEIDASAAALKKRSSEPAKAVSLNACVEAFLQPEQLSAADEWYCPKCKEFVQADKKLDLWALPEVLVVHLKRFSYTRWNRDKIDTRVDFPLAGLDLSEYVLAQQDERPLYDCFAVSNHFGGLGGGHYTAYAQMPDDKQWYGFDDSRVDQVSSPDHIVSQAAYVLFYRRRDAVQADPPDLIEQLAAQRHAAVAVAAAAAALVEASDGAGDGMEVDAAADAAGPSGDGADGDAAGPSAQQPLVLPLSAAGQYLHGSQGAGMGRRSSSGSDDSAVGEQGTPRGDPGELSDCPGCDSPGEPQVDADAGASDAQRSGDEEEDGGCSMRGMAAPSGPADLDAADATSNGGGSRDADSPTASSSDSGGSSSRARRGSKAPPPRMVAQRSSLRQIAARKAGTGAAPAAHSDGTQADVEMVESDRLL